VFFYLTELKLRALEHSLALGSFAYLCTNAQSHITLLFPSLNGDIFVHDMVKSEHSFADQFFWHQ